MRISFSCPGQDIKLPVTVVGATLKRPRAETVNMRAGRQRGISQNPSTEILVVSSLTLKRPAPSLSHGVGVFNVTTEISSESAVSTSTTAENGVQADSQQLLTKPVDTALYVTPTMTFGEVGHVSEQETTGYACRAHGVGEFTQTEILERMVKLGEFDWTVDDATTSLYYGDVDKALRDYARNSDILGLFRYYRTDIEVTVKLNTNQFYYGALMVTMFPGNNTGNVLSERAVQDPTIISASSAESVVKTWTWSWPYPWRGLSGTDAVDGMHPVWLCIDNLCKLEVAKDGMPGTVNIQLWARFKNIRLAYPYGPAAPVKAGPRSRGGANYFPHKSVQAQSGVKVAYPSKGGSKHPASDPGQSKSRNPITSVVDAVTSVPAAIIDGLVGSAADVIDSGMGALLGSFLDKPDQVDEQTPVIIEQSKDMYAEDIADTNVCFSLSKSRYVDPSMDRMPMTKKWTLLDYAKIPGLLYQGELNETASSYTFPIIKSLTDPDLPRTPLEYAVKNCMLYRGSVKLMFQFFTSSFISARVVLQLSKTNDGYSFDADYDYGLSKVINVKGDTVDYVTIPWLDLTWWVRGDDREVKLSLASDIASPETTGVPRIFFVVWAAAADDFQFQFPRLPTELEWPAPSPHLEVQAAIGHMFQAEFPPIVDSVFYDTDTGFCSAETIEGMPDLAKRYAPLNVPGGDPNFSPLTFDFKILDLAEFTYSASIGYAQFVAQRQTFFGAMRACFMFRSGGYRLRSFPMKIGQKVWQAINSAGLARAGTYYCEPFDGVSRMTVPQVSNRPYLMMQDGSIDNGGTPINGLTLVAEILTADIDMNYLAARDDVQFGYPILPSGVPSPYSPGVESKKVLSKTKRFGSTRVVA